MGKSFHIKSHLFISFLIYYLKIANGFNPEFVIPQGNLKFLYTKVNPEIQSAAARGVIERLLPPERLSEFSIYVDPDLTTSPYQDAFSVECREGKVSVKGTTGVSVLWGLNFYLKRSTLSHFSWDGNEVNLPNPLPNASIKLQINDRFRYYENACTDSYSFPWWDWNQWEKHIDWMALNGINLPLAFTGQEEIWKRIYTSIGFSETEILEYITGPAFLAWWRMGNIQKFGGPIPSDFTKKKLGLSHEILERMRSLGMLPVLPAFSGNVPQSIKTRFPNATVSQHPSWAGFNSSFSSTFILDPTDPLFLQIGQLFITEMKKEFGSDHVYGADSFNEGRPSSNDSEYLRQMANSAYNSMKSGDPNAVWLIQSWVFSYDKDFWNEETVKSYLSGVQVGNLIVLDLQAELNPVYKKFNNFENHSFIWCMLHNFGGTLGLYGAMDLVNKGVHETREAQAPLIGTGICPEGIHQNYVMYDFFNDVVLANNTLNTSIWVENYASRRYGEINDLLSEAWRILKNGVYNGNSSTYFSGRTLITRRPSLKLVEPLWYELDDLYKVMECFINAREASKTLANSPLFSHDLTDFTRQFIQLVFSQNYKVLINAFNLKKMSRFRKASSKLLEMLDDMESVLNTNLKFMVGPWLNDAERWGNTTTEKELFRYNALNQITIWGPNGEISDYAAKQWGGMTKEYYYPRWALFTRVLADALKKGKPFNWKNFRSRVLKTVEIPFTQTKIIFPAQPKGDTFQEALRIFHKWKKLYKSFVRNTKRKELD